MKEKNIEEEIKTKKEINKFLTKMLLILVFSIFIVIAFFLMYLAFIGPVKAKPIIYIYPEEEIEVSIKLSNPELLICSYPKYTNEWKVLAKKDGTLIDLKNGKSLYALYWEGKAKNAKINMKEGFCVKGEDTARFLEEKLEILGLNDREAEEFIIYWLPKMERNKYNFIRFETIEEINENMELNVNPEPDTLIRVMMDFKSINKKIEVEEQKLERVVRSGYTVVEWGGTEL